MSVTTQNIGLQLFLASIPVMLAIGGWIVNDTLKRREERRKSKEQRYIAFLESSIGFYQDSGDRHLKGEFIQELRVGWLYCPDNVIKKCNAFLETVHEENDTSAHEKEQTMADFIVTMRKDLYQFRTKLTGDDYHFWRITKT